MGEYNNIYDVETGTIVADNTNSPEYAASICPVDNLVKLRKWSDVTYLEWQNLCNKAGTSVDSLKYLIRSLIQNQLTASIIAQALGEESDFDEWKNYEDGVTFEHGSEKFNALLGTPNGSGSAWILIQHKSQLGLKRISKIKVYGQQIGASIWEPGMWMEVEDVKGDSQS
ncbi:hypothetical protein N7495_002149 [Penicillium taxi]|uniref:uncharacterized protein n=1 Tax=Penicillium taxi TaxID=168475 RepID=UPI0025458B9D|nr:uncharacterized protein N7495_002149 [Penicillium taxi]KAJ5901621.1 hypothetical protein N7495_002149 [Penicillium taxi]